MMHQKNMQIGSMLFSHPPSCSILLDFKCDDLFGLVPNAEDTNCCVPRSWWFIEPWPLQNIINILFITCDRFSWAKPFPLRNPFKKGFHTIITRLSRCIDPPEANHIPMEVLGQSIMSLMILMIDVRIIIANMWSKSVKKLCCVRLKHRSKVPINCSYLHRSVIPKKRLLVPGATRVIWSKLSPHEVYAISINFSGSFSDSSFGIPIFFHPAIIALKIRQTIATVVASARCEHSDLLLSAFGSGRLVSGRGRARNK